MGDHITETGETRRLEPLVGRLQGGTEADAIIAVTRDSVEPREVAPGTVYVDGHGNVIDLDRYMTAPRRPTGRYTFGTLEAFTDYVNAFESDGLTVWVPSRLGPVVGVLDDHRRENAKPPEPGWGDHRATLNLEPTDEWNHWAGRDGKLGTQQEFAEHIEDGIVEIVQPDGATMLELAQSFHATVGVSFSGAQRLHDGSVNVRYTEDMEATAGRAGELEVPQEFVVRVSPFIGEDPHDVTARLRYRLRDGNLTIGYKLDRPNKIVEEAMARVKASLANEFERVYVGSPRA